MFHIPAHKNVAAPAAQAAIPQFRVGDRVHCYTTFGVNTRIVKRVVETGCFVVHQNAYLAKELGDAFYPNHAVKVIA